MKDKEKSQIVDYLGLLIWGSILMGICFLNWQSRNIEQNFIAVPAKILPLEHAGRTGFNFRYEYVADDSIYYGVNFSKANGKAYWCGDNAKHLASEIEGDTLMVIYEAGQPHNSIVLIMLQQYEKYNVEPYPNSLDWIQSVSEKSC